jgi:hypothetical protein
MAGVESLLKMPPDEIRGVIAKRVELLDTKLKEHEARHKAIDEALAAQRVFGAKRQQAKSISRKVNIGSFVAASMFTGLIIVSMF